LLLFLADLFQILLKFVRKVCNIVAI